MFTAYLLNILSSSLELPRRGRLARQAKRCGSSFFCSLGFREGGDRQTPIKILGNFSPFPLQLYLKLLCESCESFEMFSNCAGRHRKRDVTTVIFRFRDLVHFQITREGRRLSV